MGSKYLGKKKNIHGFMKRVREQIWIILGIGIFLLVLVQIGLKETFLALKSVKFSYLMLSIGLIIIALQGIAFVKWIFMCDRTKMGLEIKRVLYLSSSILVSGIVSPGRVGEFVTALFVNETKGKISSIVFFNRVIESSVTFLIAVFLFGLMFSNFLSTRSWISIGGGFGIILFILYFLGTKERLGIYVLSKGKDCLMKMGNIGFSKRILNLEERIIEEVGHFYKSTKYLFSWQTILTLVLFSCFHWAIMVFANWALFISVGSEVPLHIILASMILNAIGSFVSPTPGGIGLGDILPVYFLYINGYRENVGAYLLLGRVAVYIAAFGWYFFSTGIYHKTIPAEVNDP